MDVQDVLRWLVDAKIPVAKAMSVVSALATVGVKNAEDIQQLSDSALQGAITDKPLLKKMRGKISGSQKGKKRSAGGDALPADGADGTRKRDKREKMVAEASKRAPKPPASDLTDAELRAIEIRINRSPVMVLWATEVAQLLSCDWSESVTIGRAVADWFAQRKGEYLGILEADEEAERKALQETSDVPTRTVEVLGQDVTLGLTDGEWRAISKGKLVSAKRTHAYLDRAYGNDFGAVRQAFRALAAAIPPHQVTATRRAMVLYESFRPEISKGKAGWGQSGILRLSRVMTLRDELLREAT